jgi:hypothetical protein
VREVGIASQSRAFKFPLFPFSSGIPFKFSDFGIIGTGCKPGLLPENGMTTTIDKVAWIYVVNGKVLSARSKGKDIYYLPGGKRDPELSVRIKRETVTHLGTFEAQAHDKADGVRVRRSLNWPGWVTREQKWLP